MNTSEEILCIVIYLNININRVVVYLSIMYNNKYSLFSSLIQVHSPRNRPTLPLLAFLFLLSRVRILDREAPNIQVIANSPDNINNEASVHTNSQAQAHEDKGDLIDIIA